MQTVNAAEALQELRDSIDNPDDCNTVYADWITEVVHLLVAEHAFAVIIRREALDRAMAEALITMFQMGILTARKDWNYSK